MKQYDFDKPVDRRHTFSIKWDGERMQQDPDMLPLWVADMDFEVLPEIKEAVMRQAAHGVFGYSMIPEGFYTSVQSWMERRHDWHIEKDWIVPAPGIVPALNVAVNAFTSEQDEILIFSPVYYPFLNAIVDNGRIPVQFQMDYRDGHYSIDFEALRKTLETHSVKAAIFCSPHNPVGRIWSEEEQKRLGELLRAFDILLLDDEIHMDLQLGQRRHIPFLKAVPSLMDQTLVFTAPSKTFNIAGLQVSAVIIPDPALRKTFKKYASAHGLVQPGILGLLACEAAYTYGGAWVDELLDYLRGNLDYIRTFLQTRIPEVRLVEPEGLYLVWLDFSKLGLDHHQLEDLMLHTAHLWLDEGYIFGPGGEGFERINIAAPRSTIEETMRRIEKAVQKVRQEKDTD